MHGLCHLPPQALFQGLGAVASSAVKALHSCVISQEAVGAALGVLMCCDRAPTHEAALGYLAALAQETGQVSPGRGMSACIYGVGSVALCSAA